MAEQQRPASSVPAEPASVPVSNAAPVEQAAPLSPFLQGVKTPIPGGNPGGADISYSEEFLKIKSEIDRIGMVSGKVDQTRVSQDARELERVRNIRDSKERAAAEQALRQGATLSESTGPDFQLIIELGSKVLTEKSKDIRVACYVCLALWRIRKLPGLADGLGAISILVREFWEVMYPPVNRIAGRCGAMEFLIPYLSEGLRSAELSADDRALLEAAKGTAKDLESDLKAKVPDSPPPFITLLKALDDTIVRLPKPSVAKPAGVAPAVGEGGAALPGAALPAGAEGEPKSLQAAIDLIRRSCAFLRTQDRKNAASYRMMRSMRWDPLGVEPPNENGRTKIEPPPAPRRTYFAGLRQNAQWDKLLEEGEAGFAQPPYHFWLDLQAFIVSALDALGPEFQQARNAVLQELAILLQRVPRLPSLTFTDGTAFASPATQSWIEETVLPVLGGAGSAGSPSTSGIRDGRMASAFAQARKILDRGDLAGAVGSLQNTAVPDGSRRSSFEKRLYTALLCIRGNQVPMARPLLEELAEEIDRYALGDWDPFLALETWKHLHRSYETLAATGPAQSKQQMLDLAAKVFEKICRLDTGYALAMTGTKPKEAPKVSPAPTEKPESEPGAVPAESESASPKEKLPPRGRAK
jgi:type VI secretion system protein VasJ